MEFDQAWQMGQELEQEPITKENRFNKLMSAIKNNNESEMTRIINEFPRQKIRVALHKLKRPKYRKYKGLETAISKLRWRRGY